MRTIETYYLVDYENVHGDGLSGCQDLGMTEHIVIFFTQNAKNIDMRDICNHGKATLEMIEVPAGKQSADMHIASYLGYLLGKNGKDCKALIVSKDADFDNVIKFWKHKTSISISRTEQIKKKGSPTPQPAKKANTTKKAKLNQEVMQAVRNAGFSAAVANTVAKLATGFYGDKNMLLQIHNALRELYSDYLQVYGAAKPVLSKYADDTSSKKSTPVPVTSKDKTAANKEIQRLLSKAGYPNDLIAHVASTATKNLGVKNGKQQTYRTIISKYGQKKGLVIYNHIKNHL